MAKTISVTVLGVKTEAKEKKNGAPWEINGRSGVSKDIPAHNQIQIKCRVSSNLVCGFFLPYDSKMPEVGEVLELDLDDSTFKRISEMMPLQKVSAVVVSEEW